MAGSYEQHVFDGRVLLYWRASTQLLWRVPARGAGWRRLGGYFHGLGNADGKRGMRRGVTHGRPAARRVWPRVLPSDAAADGGPRIDFRGGHLGCKRHTPLWIPRLNDYCRAHRHGSDRYQHCLLLRVCGSAGPNARQDGHDGHCPAIGVSGGLYRCADCVEWNQRAALVSPLQSRIQRRHLWHPT